MSLHFSLRVSAAPKASVIISISKKVAKKAVTRNLVKRRVRAVMRTLVQSLKPGSYLLIAKPGVEKLRGAELFKELEDLLKKS